MNGILLVVATPIGNLSDLSPRAREALAAAEFVACEDTRVTKKLLSHFGIHTPAVTLPKVLKLLEEGKTVALVSDAGTPGVSDPGQELVSRARAQGARIEAVAGPSALAAALSVCGLRAATFTFWGFLPLKKGREKLFNEIAASPRASVFYESPHRMMKTLAALAAKLPAQRRVGVYRELTKLHEEHVVGSPVEALAHFEANPDRVRGEFVVIVEGE